MCVTGRRLVQLSSGLYWKGPSPYPNHLNGLTPRWTCEVSPMVPGDTLHHCLARQGVIYIYTYICIYIYTCGFLSHLMKFGSVLFYKREVSGDTEPCDLLRVFRLTLSGPRSFTRCLLPSQLYLASLLRVCKLPQTFRWGFSSRHFDLLRAPSPLSPTADLFICICFIFILFMCDGCRRIQVELVWPSGSVQPARRTDWTQRESNEQRLVSNLAR